MGACPNVGIEVIALVPLWAAAMIAKVAPATSNSTPLDIYIIVDLSEDSRSLKLAWFINNLWRPLRKPGGLGTLSSFASPAKAQRRDRHNRPDFCNLARHSRMRQESVLIW